MSPNPSLQPTCYGLRRRFNEQVQLCGIPHENYCGRAPFSRCRLPFAEVRSMSASLVEELSRRARDLPPEERVKLAEEILATVHGVDEDVDAEWDAEIKRRIAEIEGGTAQLIPAEEVFARLRSRPK